MNKKVVIIMIFAGLFVLMLGSYGIVSAVKGNQTAGKSEEEINQLQESIKSYADEKTGILSEKSAKRGEDGEAVENIAATPMPTATPVSADRADGDILYQNISFDTQRQLAEMMSYWADNNQKALNDLAFLDHYKAMSYSLVGTNDFYYYGEEDVTGMPNGVGIAVYADNQYYYGTWIDGKRSKAGIFLHYHIYETANSKDIYSYHFYTGEWKDDLPFGEGMEHYEFNQHNLQKGIGYNSNLIGTYQDGLYNGDFYITNLYSDGNVKEWDATANAGVFVYQSANKDKVGRRTVQVDRKDANNYIWIYPKDNKDLGVQCVNRSGKRN